jgi:hypothetical protein
MQHAGTTIIARVQEGSSCFYELYWKKKGKYIVIHSRAGFMAALDGKIKKAYNAMQKCLMHKHHTLATVVDCKS